MFWFPGFTLPPKPCAAGELRQQTDRGKQGETGARPPRSYARNALRIRRAASLRSTPGIFSGACSKRKRSSRKIRGSHIARAEQQKSSTRFPKSKAPDIFHGRCPGLCFWGSACYSFAVPPLQYDCRGFSGWSVFALSMLPKKFRVSSGGRLLSLSVTRSARMTEGGVPLFPPVSPCPSVAAIHLRRMASAEA